MTIKLNKILCVDLEATCYENNIFPQGEERDIIEIGVAVLNIETWEITNNFGILIKPNHSKISEFCTNLTTLTYPFLKKHGCATYEQAINRLIKLYGPKNKIWVSWGNYDRWAIERECIRENVKYPFGATHFNVKEMYSIWKGLNKGLGLGKAIDKENLPKDGTAHRGYVDAYWVAQILRQIMQGKVVRK